jgi:hypothetical protein
MMYQYPSKPTLRVSKADNGRVLPLGSAAWRKLRRAVLASEPCCRMCTAMGLTVIATDLDHRDNDPSNNDILNLVPLCHSCHSKKTMRDSGHNVRMGCATDGTPLDYQHHWNNATGAVLARPAAEKSLEGFGCIPSVLPSFNANCETQP